MFFTVFQIQGIYLPFKQIIFKITYNVDSKKPKS